jgi:hypothetical protein
MKTRALMVGGLLMALCGCDGRSASFSDGSPDSAGARLADSSPDLPHGQSPSSSDGSVDSGLVHLSDGSPDSPQAASLPDVAEARDDGRGTNDFDSLAVSNDSRNDLAKPKGEDGVRKQDEASAGPADASSDSRDSATRDTKGVTDSSALADTDRDPDTRSDSAEERAMLKVPIQAEHIALDPARGYLYASVAGAAADYPNTIVVLHAQTGAVLSSIPVGSNPGVLALSDDGTMLWVGLDGSAAIRRIGLSTSTPELGPLHVLPKPSESSIGPTKVTAMKAIPGSPLSVLVTLNGAGGANAVLDDGVARSTMCKFPDPVSTELAMGPAGYAFGLDDSNTGFPFVTLAISSAGVTCKKFSDLAQGFDNGILYRDGRAYTRSGDIIDVSDPAKPALVDHFGYLGPVSLGGDDRLVMLGMVRKNQMYLADRPSLMLVLDTVTRQTVASTSFPSNVFSFATIEGWIEDFVYAGGDTVVFITESGDDQGRYTRNLFIVRDPVFREAEN